MSNVNRYAAAAAKGATAGVRKEWHRTQSLGAVIEYAFLPKEGRAAYAASRAALAVGKGAYTGVKSERAAVREQQQAQPLRAVPDAPGATPAEQTGGKHRKGA